MTVIILTAKGAPKVPRCDNREEVATVSIEAGPLLGDEGGLFLWKRRSIKRYLVGIHLR